MFKDLNFSQLTLHKDINERLIKIANDKDAPHLLLYGPSGSGKRTRARAFICEYFKIPELKTSIATKDYKKLTVNLIHSEYHIELCPSKADASIVIDVINEMVLNTTVKKHVKFLLLHGLDKVDKIVQNGLKAVMEKYYENCRFICTTNSLSKIDKALASRMTHVRIPAPESLEFPLAFKSHMDIGITDELVRRSNKNLREFKILFDSQICSHLEVKNSLKKRISDKKKFQETMDKMTKKLDEEMFNNKPKMEMDIDFICKSIIKKQDIKTFEMVQAKYIEMIADNVLPGEIITLVLKGLLSPHVEKISSLEKKRKLHPSDKDDNVTIYRNLCQELTELAAEYEYSMCQGMNPIYHLDAFVSKAMVKLSQIKKR